MNLFTTDNTATFDTDYITIDGYRIFERRSKTNHRQTIVLIHGINVSEKYFRPLASQLQKTHNVLAIDLPGFGSSNNDRRALPFTTLADIVASYIKKRSKTSVVLIGQSMGTQVTARVAMDHPALIKKLILIAPTINKKERHLGMQILRLAQDSFREPPAVNAIVLTDFFRFGPVKFWRTQRQMINDRIENILKHTTVPTLFVAGEKDPLSPPDWAIWLSKRARHSQVAVIDNAPHNLQMTHAKELHDVCIQFLK